MRERKQYGSWTLDTTGGHRLQIVSFTVHNEDGSTSGETEHWCSVFVMPEHELAYPTFMVPEHDRAVQVMKSIGDMLDRERTEMMLENEMMTSKNRGEA